MSEHISSYFHQELEQVRTDVLVMGGLIESQLQQALEALFRADKALLETVAQEDEKINRLEVVIDDACQMILVRRQPTAGDLRLVLAVSRIITDLERMGDEIKKIALYAKDLIDKYHTAAEQLNDTRRLLEMVVPMLRESLDAFARLDENTIVRMNELDKSLDAAYHNQARVVLTYMMEDPQVISIGMKTMLMNKAVERIGDHAKNVCEHVVYLVRGMDVRHLTPEQIKQGL